MRFTTTSLARLITAFFLIAFVTAAPVAVTTSSTGLSAAGQEGGARIAERDLSSSPIVGKLSPIAIPHRNTCSSAKVPHHIIHYTSSLPFNIHFCEQWIDLTSIPPDTDVAAAEAKKREFSSTMWALKDRLLMKRQPKPEPAAEPKRFTLDDFTTIAAANEKYDGLRPEGAGFVGLKQRGLPGWSRIY